MAVFALRWLANYLLDRSQFVVVGGESSSSAKVLSGVPQGSVLGPLLFLLYIDDVAEVLVGICLMVLFSFADDICLYVEIGCPGDFDLVQANLDAVFSSLCRKLMCFNASKCKYMLISRSPNKTLPTSEMELNGEAIERVTVFGCLGFRSKLVPPHSENYKAC